MRTKIREENGEAGLPKNRDKEPHKTRKRVLLVFLECLGLTSTSRAVRSLPLWHASGFGRSWSWIWEICLPEPLTRVLRL